MESLSESIRNDIKPSIASAPVRLGSADLTGTFGLALEPSRLLVFYLRDKKVWRVLSRFSLSQRPLGFALKLAIIGDQLECALLLLVDFAH